MIVRLFCPKCAHELSKSLEDYAEIDVPMPVSSLSENGEYEVLCGRGHRSFVVLNNLKFELLFEMGLNALVDGYCREAVSSFAASLERFYEFHWRVTTTHFLVPEEAVAGAWKSLSRQSERQLGAYISGSLLLFKECPSLLNNKQIKFRNSVIHKGYIPVVDEAASFGDDVMALINRELERLRLVTPESLKRAYEALLPKGRKESRENTYEVTGAVNILTPVDTMTPPKSSEDTRQGNVLNQLARIIKEREPKKLVLLSKEEMKRRYPERF